MKNNLLHGTRTKGAAGRSAMAAACMLALAVPLAAPLPHAGTPEALAAPAAVKVSTAGYGAESDVNFTYDRKTLSLDKAKFSTTNEGEKPKAGGKVGFCFAKGGVRVAYSRGGTTSQVRESAVILRGRAETKEGSRSAQSVPGQFTLTWEKAAVDAFGKKYDVEMTVSDVKYCNPTGMQLDNGIAILQGPHRETAKINSDEKLSTVPEKPDRERDLKRKRTVDAEKPWKVTSRSDEDGVGAEQGMTSACAWVCDFTNASGHTYRNIEDLHEKYYTGVRKGDTWDGKTWVSAKTGETYTSGDGKRDDADKKLWKVHSSWTSDELSDDINETIVGVTMKVRTSVKDPASGEAVRGGTLGMGFRDLDQPDLGSGGGDYTPGMENFNECIAPLGGFVDDTVYMRKNNCLQGEHSKGTLKEGELSSLILGTKTTTPENSKDSGFTAKVDAAGFSYGWAGSKCATPLFTSTNLSPSGVDIAVMGRKTVDGHAPGAGAREKFAFRLYRERSSSSDEDTAVMSWSDRNKQLDAKGKTASEKSPQAPLSARCDDGGAFSFHLNYWSLMHALGYDNLEEIAGMNSENGVYGAWHKLIVAEDLGTEAFSSGSYVADASEQTAWIKVEPDGNGGAVYEVRYGDAREAAPEPINNLEVVRARISVNKHVVNESPLPTPDLSGKFAFDLSAVDGGPSPKEGTSTVTNPSPDGGTGIFGSVDFSREGTYTYKIVERRVDDADAVHFVRDDPSARSGKYVTVRVYVGSDARKHAEVAAKDDSYSFVSLGTGPDGGVAGVEFENAYVPPSLEIPVKKTLKVGEGAMAPDIAGAFTFSLAAEQDAPLPCDGKTSVQNPDSDGGTASFGKIWYAEPGSYSYTVSEQGSVEGVCNDASSSKRVAVEVSDAGDVTVNGGEELGFTNYVPTPAKVALGAVKVLKCDIPGARTPDITGRFTFELEPMSGHAPMPQKSEVVNPDFDGGTAWFGGIVLNKEGTYCYRVTEKGMVEGIENDPHAREGKSVAFTVSFDRADNRLVARDASGADASKVLFSFDNTYTPTVAMPVAGGGFSWPATAAAGAGMVVVGVLLGLARRRRMS